LSFVAAVVVEPLLSTAQQTKWPQPVPTPSLIVPTLFLSVMMGIYVSLFLDRLFSHCSTIVFSPPFRSTLLLSCLCVCIVLILKKACVSIALGEGADI
jgi:hypothetical protein